MGGGLSVLFLGALVVLLCCALTKKWYKKTCRIYCRRRLTNIPSLCHPLLLSTSTPPSFQTPIIRLIKLFLSKIVTSTAVRWYSLATIFFELSTRGAQEAIQSSHEE